MDAPGFRTADSPRLSAEALEQRKAGQQRLIAVGGILGALAAASCYVVPFALFTLGISGAWISNLTALEPYQPIFAAVTFGFLGYGFYLVYRRPKRPEPMTAIAPNRVRAASPRSGSGARLCWLQSRSGSRNSPRCSSDRYRKRSDPMIRHLAATAILAFVLSPLSAQAADKTVVLSVTNANCNSVPRS
jgi:hypothetical protein